MILLGIDPGSRIIGFGVIEQQQKKYRYISSGCIKAINYSSLYDRIKIIVSEMEQLIEMYQPDEVAIEKVFVNNNPNATLTLGQARGAILATVALKNLPLFEYTALQVKKAVVGYGKANKLQVQHMIIKLLSLSGCPNFDSSDALAIAITHAGQRMIHK